MSTATACACERSSEQRHSSTSPATASVPSPCGPPPARPSAALAARQTCVGQRLLPTSSIARAPSLWKLAHPGAARAPEAPQRRERIPGHGQSGLGDLQHELGCREVELLRVVGEDVLKAPRELGLLARERDRVDEQVPGVPGAGVGEHPLVGAVDLGELALERRLGGIGRRAIAPSARTRRDRRARP